MKSKRIFGEHNIIYQIYEKLVNSIILQYYNITNKKQKGVIDKHDNGIEVIISLTSYPDRIQKVCVCIESLLRQSLKPNRIILWLAESQFKNKCIPKSLMRQIPRGLEVRFCEDLMSYKKIYFTYDKFPNSIIITVDDDALYPKNFVKKMIDVHLKYPKDVCCYRAHEITFDSDNNIKPYIEWNRKSIKGYYKSTHCILATGVGGILYPPSSLPREVLNKHIFMKLAPYSDDLWLKTMCILNDTKIRRVTKHSKNWVLIDGTQNTKLCRYNVADGGNDRQFTKLLDYYKLKGFNIK